MSAHRFTFLRSRYRGRHAGGKALCDDPNNARLLEQNVGVQGPANPENIDPQLNENSVLKTVDSFGNTLRRSGGQDNIIFSESIL